MVQVIDFVCQKFESKTVEMTQKGFKNLISDVPV